MGDLERASNPSLRRENVIFNIPKKSAKIMGAFYGNTFFSRNLKCFNIFRFSKSLLTKPKFIFHSFFFVSFCFFFLREFLFYFVFRIHNFPPIWPYLTVLKKCRCPPPPVLWNFKDFSRFAQLISERRDIHI